MARKPKQSPASAVGPLPIFAEPVPGPDQNTFTVEHGSDNPTYAQVEALLKTQVVAFPKSRAADDALFTLADAYGPSGAAIAEQITQSGRIVFHSVGDTGASDVRRYQNEQRVADRVTTDAQAERLNASSFNVRGRGCPAAEPENGADVSYLEVEPAVKATHLQLEQYDDHDYGYLRISADAHQLRIAYHQCNARSLLQSRYDLVTIDLATHALKPNG